MEKMTRDWGYSCRVCTHEGQSECFRPRMDDNECDLHDDHPGQCGDVNTYVNYQCFRDTNKIPQEMMQEVNSEFSPLEMCGAVQQGSECGSSGYFCIGRRRRGQLQ